MCSYDNFRFYDLPSTAIRYPDDALELASQHIVHVRFLDLYNVTRTLAACAPHLGVTRLN